MSFPSSSLNKTDAPPSSSGERHPSGASGVHSGKNSNNDGSSSKSSAGNTAIWPEWGMGPIYDPKPIMSEGGWAVHISNLLDPKTERKLKKFVLCEYLVEFGAILELHIFKNFAQVKFENKEDADRCITTWNGRELPHGTVFAGYVFVSLPPTPAERKKTAQALKSAPAT